MNKPDHAQEKDEQLPKQVSRVLAADNEAPSAATDQRILQFAVQHAPVTQSARWKTWMPAAAACCLVGVLTLSLLPEQQAERTKSMDIDMQVTKSRGATRELAAQSNAADAILADELMFEESEAAVSAPTISLAAAKAPATDLAAKKMSTTLLLPPEFFEQLVALTDQEGFTKTFAAGLANGKTSRSTIQPAKKVELYAAEADSPSLIHTKPSQNDKRNEEYETLRRECHCGLPDSLQQALAMLASQSIQADISEPQARDNKQ
ncbi:MAG: hypothetical protein AB8B48_06635 [Pseudomonadales bacterium]